MSFELGKEKKAFFVSSRAWDRENIFSPHEASEGLRFDDGDSEFFLCPTLVTRRKISYSIFFGIFLI